MVGAGSFLSPPRYDHKRTPESEESAHAAPFIKTCARNLEIKPNSIES